VIIDQIADPGAGAMTAGVMGNVYHCHEDSPAIEGWPEETG